MWRHFLAFLFVLALSSALGEAQARAQIPPLPGAADEDDLEPMPPGKDAAPESPAAQVDVVPTATDEQIAQRLEKILKATPDWFYEPNVEVREGVAILRGQTETEERRKWAGDLARSTEDVVAVVNLIDVLEPAAWDFAPAWAGINELWRTSVRRLPWIVFSLGIIILAYLVARLTQTFLQLAFRSRFGSQLLRNIAAWIGGAVVFLLGLYIVLYVSGLTRLALTVLGGTGLIGLILGIGFRDITENFLASIFLSVQTPFRNGDVVEVSGITGVVQRMTIRSTLLMTFEGNHVQIPNSVIYKSTITNYTANPNRRIDFTVGIGYDVEIAQAQAAALDVLRGHPAVVKEPESMVLAEALAASSVILRVYFWVNVDHHAWEKVRSSVIRLIKQRFETDGITMPDDAREVVFPQGVPVEMLSGDGKPRRSVAPVAPRTMAPADTSIATTAEGDLGSETEKIKQQAERSRTPEGGEDLLQGKSDQPA